MECINSRTKHDTVNGFECFCDYIGTPDMMPTEWAEYTIILHSIQCLIAMYDCIYILYIHVQDIH